MKFNIRLKSLEKKFQVHSKLWAVFVIRYYEKADERKKAQEVLLSEYLSQDNPRPDYRLFIQDANNKQEERFLHSFLSH